MNWSALFWWTVGAIGGAGSTLAIIEYRKWKKRYEGKRWDEVAIALRCPRGHEFQMIEDEFRMVTPRVVCPICAWWARHPAEVREEGSDAPSA